MYKVKTHHQISMEDFNQSLGVHLDPNNRWIKKAALIPWSELEPEYASLFSRDTGNPAKNFRMALGSLLIQTEFSWSNEETVAQIRENPYLQYFIGLHGFQWDKPFDASTMVHFSKRLSHEKIDEINEKILVHYETSLKDDQDKDDPSPPSGGTSDNQGTLMLDATCAPSNIRYPQDVSLLNESREKAEEIIDALCNENRLKKPRTDRNAARRAYLDFAKSKKRTFKKRRKAVKKQLGYVTRDIHHIERLQEQSAVLNENQAITFYTICRIKEQQQEMYDCKTTRVDDRIVSFTQPYLRPILRGKVKASTEFGAKLDVSQSNGFVRIEHVSFNAFNESTDLKEAVERYKERTGVYPERILVDQIYRTRGNRRYCKKHHIRLSGPQLGRPAKEEPEDKVFRYQDEVERIQVEREFSLAKSCHGLGKITKKLAGTTLTAISLAILSLNLSKIQRECLCSFFTRAISQFIVLNPYRNRFSFV